MPTKPPDWQPPCVVGAASMDSAAPSTGAAGSVGEEPRLRFRESVLDARSGSPYTEEAFRYFLALERRRTARAGRALVLVLVRLTPEPRGERRIGRAVAARLFGALRVSVREVDFMGWYRSERIAGAVLMQRTASPSRDVCRRIGERAGEALRGRVSARIARRVRVRVVLLAPGRRV